MATSKLHRNPALWGRPAGRQRGFTIVETLVAITILVVGLLGAAALLSQLNLNSTQSRYASSEALLASEKLEDLNHLMTSDPSVANPGGSLTADVSQTVTVGAANVQIDYFDQIQTSAGAGGMTEIVTGTDATGKANYTTTTHTPDGQVSITTSAGAPPPPAADTLVYKRRWAIEQDQPIAGVRRITVSVTLQNGSNSPPFQTSLVRP